MFTGGDPVGPIAGGEYIGGISSGLIRIPMPLPPSGGADGIPMPFVGDADGWRKLLLFM